MWLSMSIYDTRKLVLSGRSAWFVLPLFFSSGADNKVMDDVDLGPQGHIVFVKVDLAELARTAKK